MPTFLHYVTTLSLIGITFFVLLHALWAYQGGKDENGSDALPALTTAVSQEELRRHIEQLEHRLQDQSQRITRIENKLTGVGAIAMGTVGTLFCLYNILLQKNDLAEGLSYLALFTSFGIYGLVKVSRT